MRLKLKYEKEMQNYNPTNHSWSEIANIAIVRHMEELSTELNGKGFKFKYDVKPDSWGNRKGIIKIRTNMTKSAVLMVLHSKFGGKLEFIW